jgi:hypothetical protein
MTSVARRSRPARTMIITEPNDLAAEVHDRMPVFLREEQFSPWLSGEAGGGILKPAPNDYVQRWPVSKRVVARRPTRTIGGSQCCTSLASRSRAESAVASLTRASRADCFFVTCANRKASGCGSAAVRIPLRHFPPSPAACISGPIGVFARRRQPPKRLHSVGANGFGFVPRAISAQLSASLPPRTVE